MTSLLVHPALTAAVLRAAEEHDEKVNHWLIGAIALVILFGAMFALLAFGKGREHS